MYPTDGTRVKHRAERRLLGFEFSKLLPAGVEIASIVGLTLYDSRGADKTAEFRAGEPPESIADYTDEDTGTVYTQALVRVWTKKATGVEQARGSYRPELKVLTSDGQELTCMIGDPTDSTSFVLPFLLVTDGITKLPPGMR